jgi:diacylglycerol kinase (ATP)
MINFITGRIKAIFYSLKGAFLLLKTEHSIQAQSLIALIFIIAGFFLKYQKLSGFFKFWQFV